MSVNYLILVHKSPAQFKRLIEVLDAPWVQFFIHVDKKCNLTDFESMVPADERVHYVSEENRVDGRWGDLSLVDAALACMRLMIAKGGDGHSVLLSGQDYPLRSPEYVRDFFDAHQENNFMSVYPIPDPKKVSENGGMERLISYTFDCRNPQNARMKAKIQPLSLRLKTILGFIRLARFRRDLLRKAVKLYFKKREYPEVLSKHFNEFWCAFNADAIKQIVATFDQNPEIREYYKYTHIPDETAFSSILLKNAAFEKTLMPMCHYIDWETSKDGSPKTIGCDDLPRIKKELEAKPYLMFARKFECDSKVFDEIDLMRC